MASGACVGAGGETPKVKVHRMEWNKVGVRVQQQVETVGETVLQPVWAQSGQFAALGKAVLAAAVNHSKRHGIDALVP